MNRDKIFDPNLSHYDFLKALDELIETESVSLLETDEEYLKRIGEAIVDVSPKPKHARVSRSKDLPSIDHSDFGMNYRMIRPPSKRIEEA